MGCLRLDGWDGGMGGAGLGGLSRQGGALLVFHVVLDAEGG